MHPVVIIEVEQVINSRINAKVFIKYSFIQKSVFHLEFSTYQYQTLPPLHIWKPLRCVCLQIPRAA